ncbi:NADH-quinone oxidoreductase subunit J family protein [Neomoorella thermoacetica]|uniref:NADH-quinone oxidoreductase subunit J n=2 Tax=Neomoorella thermoacetica TaxID=1525 RepID=A0A1D7X9W0_NEOTH|nr:NADH-quinone oxidoreductase subunit J [Moorella thermoacetica]AKX93742.1 NADH-quinone oxidoreductase subunit J [Moorella thermoacetica]AKX96384.1 NADH-quinone oxidoreductase subunit J [Moorella thermoacetica]AOQ23664.1 NADH-quinone oxidoreductase subunit J [Moorella thermoacetica]APC08101.1 NADH-quinone oxidoreductase subunit J [Moorella thermoacetica]OIQ10888.1 NADH-quinone oxidoreductase subunit J [Moorella thermoacetica]
MLDISALLFWVLAAITIAAALAVVLLKNIVHSALYLVLTFAGVAGLYILLQAEFLAAVQLLVYAGAVAILIVFAVMLTRRGDIKASNLFNINYLAAGVVSLALFVVIVLGTGRMTWTTAPAQAPANNVAAIANAFLGRFAIPFEVAAVLLLVAMVGAILLARGGKPER